MNVHYVFSCKTVKAAQTDVLRKMLPLLALSSVYGSVAPYAVFKETSDCLSNLGKGMENT